MLLRDYNSIQSDLRPFLSNQVGSFVFGDYLTKQITFRQAYRGLRNEGVDILAAAFVAVVWVIYGVEIEE